MILPDTFTAFLLWGLAWFLAVAFFSAGMSVSRRLVG